MIRPTLDSAKLHRLSRRRFLGRAALLGCSAAASPLMTPVSLAAAPWDTRIVVIILRGAMDGLDALRPYGDPDFALIRPEQMGERDKAPDLDGFSAMHPALAPLVPLWAGGELGFVQAVATPYRNKRSHFDGQDILEAGTPDLGMARDGWLNRMLQELPGIETQTAYAVGQGEMKVLLGPAEVAEWTPNAALRLSPQALRLAELIMEQDPAFHAAMSEAVALSDEGEGILAPDTPLEKEMGQSLQGAQHVKIAEFVGNRLREDTRVAAFSMIGWDTHGKQARNLTRSLSRFAETLISLRDTCGPDVWSRTAVVAMTEFGRTVRLNGTEGTDHGTGGTMVLAGGAIRGGRVLGTWPGLSEADLFKRRDLTPTSDVRAPAAWILRAATGLDRTTLEQVVFPGLDMGRDPGVIL
ncbi:MAG: twin-arginine translocation pathway signal [Rhodobacteraceae bacterium]|nr:twin-arginine translocation pathway signal [Paracoccaceae bacterium]MAY47983.1 twin-arginine translocation pathway signal [Paracoccaceae bacterium]